MSDKWLTWAKEIQAISQAGLAYAKDVYDVERYQRLRELSTEILEEYTEEPMEKIINLFTNETGYQTPKVDIRAVVFHEGELLFVQEKSDGKWALPGGWADIGFSPKEVAAKEVYEEAGIEVAANQLLGVVDMHKHPHPPMASHIYKIFIACNWEDGDLKGGTETDHAAFFQKDKLPELSIARNTYEQIEHLFTMQKETLRPFCD
ncbi:NUDIX hydrolase [Thalassobacillus devorans]|uniref:NUDIX hydrolase n=1 Tax=Thalassobacillus devorans TaxID=279813 RepID=UPI00048AC525|nr:NUDIX hydrolase [Thalassobacillus devorans]